jgi:tRNA (guanine37-N1)-methyltransferase
MFPGVSICRRLVGPSLTNRLRAILSNVLSPKEVALIPNSYDIIGDIAILRLEGVSRKHHVDIAKAVMRIHRNIKTVVTQTSPVRGDFRIRELRHLAGEDKTVTTHIESGCAFSVDISKCYFSPRLSHERMRVARLVRDGDVVVNMFAGVGCFSLVIARFSKASRIYSIDVNPYAIKFMQENIKLNGAFGRVIPILGDAKEVIEANLRHVGQRVLLPLPKKALESLPYALLALKPSGGWIHYYDFEHSKKRENVVEKVKLKISEKLDGFPTAFEVPFSRVVRSTGPNWYQVVLDIAVRG